MSNSGHWAILIDYDGTNLGLAISKLDTAGQLDFVTKLKGDIAEVLRKFGFEPETELLYLADRAYNGLTRTYQALEALGTLPQRDMIRCALFFSIDGGINYSDDMFQKP